jgi:hypothetical protein
MGATKRMIEDATYKVMATFSINDDDESDNFTKVFDWIMENCDFSPDSSVINDFYHANICPQCMNLTWGETCCAILERV